jgi:hypothetical protein
MPSEPAVLTRTDPARFQDARPARTSFRSRIGEAGPPDTSERHTNPQTAIPPAVVPRIVRIAGAVLCLTLVGFGVMRFPVIPGILAGVLAAYGVLLWYRPVGFLLVLPVVLPAWDLGLWSGWMMVGGSDFFILTTLAVLMVRAPPKMADLLPTGLSRIVLLAFTASWFIATVTGWSSPLDAAYSDNAFLRPDNALRLAKGFVEALVLLPFLRQRERTHADAVSLLGWGMAAGIAVVTAMVLVERALFTDILDFTASYRVAGPFSSMRVGGGHIGAYIVLALPMALCLPRLQPRWMAMGLLLLTCLLGGYTLVITFARTAYVAGLIALAVAGFGWLWASRRQHRPVVLGLIPVLLVLAALAAAASFGGMRDRLADSAKDFETRRANWTAGLAVRDTGVLPGLFGMGLGTYQRTMLMRSPINRPSDIVLKQDRQGTYVSMLVETPFFLGQKISPPSTGDLHLTLLARGFDGQATLNVMVCEKVLLYSDHCRGDAAKLTEAGVWQPIAITLPVAGLDSETVLGWLRRPVELSLLGGPVGHRVEVRDLRLADDAGQKLLANGDFTRGLDRWIFTDDSHVSWRMLNQYLMLWFETGALGVAAFLALGGLAVAGGIRATWRGAVTGAAVAGSVVGFMVSGLFDNVLEAPRLATLFFLVCLCGLVQWEDRRHRPRLVRST